MKIAIFGGAFDPVHNGHTALAQSCVADISPDLLILVPTADPPHKNLPALASKGDRAHMLSLAFSDFNNVRICEIEFERPGKSYTYDTFFELKDSFEKEFKTKNIEYYLIIGADEFLNFHKWFKYKELLSEVVLYTARRAGASRQDMISYAGKYLGGGNYIISNSAEIPAASSEIRQKIKSGADFSAFLNNKVYNYIESKGLYGV
ncbi:MAG: nicotinate (nicotinamide) nucleotide adenylyltransferase [Clostridiales bacterium]|nr:nicotinate (nicotinamide) nucleotide adenylyltransferase [Clostridiales bacterium]